MEYQKQKGQLEKENQNLKEKRNQEHKFKDKCDICNTFDYCKGYKDKVLCELCLKKAISESNFVIEGQLSIFDILGGNSYE